MAKAKEVREGYINIGKHEWRIEWFKGVTLDHAINVLTGVDVSDGTIKKIWKAANNLSVPNHLKDQIKD